MSIGSGKALSIIRSSDIQKRNHYRRHHRPDAVAPPPLPSLNIRLRNLLALRPFRISSSRSSSLALVSVPSPAPAFERPSSSPPSGIVGISSLCAGDNDRGRSSRRLRFCRRCLRSGSDAVDLFKSLSYPASLRVRRLCFLLDRFLPESRSNCTDFGGA